MKPITAALIAALLGASLMTPSALAQAPAEATRYTIFMNVHATPEWLALSPGDRFEFLGEEIEPILARHPGVAMRFYDTEFYNADVSDVIVFETEDLDAYQSVVEALRETRFWGRYFEVRAILPGVENAYATAYDRTPIGER